MAFCIPKRTEIPDTSRDLQTSAKTNDVKSIFLQCLSEIFRKDNFDQQRTKGIYDSMETLDVPAGEMILNIGEDGVGVFMIINGQVEILDKVDDELVVINEKREWEYFGEVSTMFNITVTACVRTATRCMLLYISKENCDELFKKPAVTLIDWFVQNRYLPTNIPGLQGDRIIRRHTLQVLTQLPILWGWDVGVLKKIISMKKSDIIKVYPPSTAVILHDDPVNHILIVLHGSVIVKHNETRKGFCIDKTPFVIGETDYFRATNSCISVYTKTYCQILIINRELLDDSLQRNRDKNTLLEWANHEQSFQKFGQEEGTNLPDSLSSYRYFEVLHFKISNSSAFKSVSPIFTYKIILKSDIIILPARQKLDVTSKFGLIQVVHGMVSIYEQSFCVSKKIILKEGDLTWYKDIKNMKNPSDNNVLIVQYSKHCLQSVIPYCSQSDRQITWIADIIANYTHHNLSNV